MSNYKFGRRYEYKERDYWRDKGWYAQRAYGSKGPWDVYAVSPDGAEVIFIQVKAYREGSRQPSLAKARKRLKELPSGPNVTLMIAVHGPALRGRKTPRREFIVADKSR